jgi:Fe-S oxidoreductase
MSLKTIIMNDFDIFVLPFLTGTIFLFAVLIVQFVRWFTQTSKKEKQLIGRHFFSTKTLKSVGECFSECLLHFRVFKKNPRLGYMHTSIAFGWFMLIVVGKLQSIAATQMWIDPPYMAIFLKYFFPKETFPHAAIYGFIMDFFLALVLSGLIAAVFKRLHPKALGMEKPTKHTRFDKIALSALWLIFPFRLLAESFTSAFNHSGSFLTGTLGSAFNFFIPVQQLSDIAYISWWLYSLALGVFFCFLPFSRYMHIFSEIGLIFLRNWGLKTENNLRGFAQYELYACSRCGMCIDVCQLNTDVKINDVQAVYFLRGERYHTLSRRLTNNCLMCGRCEEICPVLIKNNRHRLLSRRSPFQVVEHQYAYLNTDAINVSTGEIAYFAGCMTHLTPSIKEAMLRIFEKTKVSYTFIDEQQGVCCGRPLLLSGTLDAMNSMIDANRKLIAKSQAKLLVTSCPICYKFFKENYQLPIPVMHHTEYIDRLIESGQLAFQRGNKKFVYHDPCELGRLSGIYEQPRHILQCFGILQSIREEKQDALCCGGSLANTEINYAERANIVKAAVKKMCVDNPDYLVTACPLCKKSFNKKSTFPVKDIAEIVVQQF